MTEDSQEQNNNSSDLSPEEREKLERLFKKTFPLMGSSEEHEAHRAHSAVLKILKRLDLTFFDLLGMMQQSGITEEEVEQALSEYVQANTELKKSETFLLGEIENVNNLLRHFKDKTFAPPNIDPENFKPVLEEFTGQYQTLIEGMEKYKQPDDPAATSARYDEAILNVMQSGPGISPSSLYGRVLVAMLGLAGYPVSMKGAWKAKTLVQEQGKVIKDQAGTIEKQNTILSTYAPRMQDSIGLILDASSPKDLYDALVNDAKDLRIRCAENDSIRAELDKTRRELEDANCLNSAHLRTIDKLEERISVLNRDRSSYQKLRNQFQEFMAGGTGAAPEGDPGTGSFEDRLEMRAQLEALREQTDKANLRSREFSKQNEELINEFKGTVEQLGKLEYQLGQKKASALWSPEIQQDIQAIKDAKDAIGQSARATEAAAKSYIESLSSKISNVPAFAVAAGSMTGWLTYVANHASSWGSSELAVSTLVGGLVAGSLASIVTKVKTSSLNKTIQTTAENIQNSVSNLEAIHEQIDKYAMDMSYEINQIHSRYGAWRLNHQIADEIKETHRALKDLHVDIQKQQGMWEEYLVKTEEKLAKRERKIEEQEGRLTKRKRKGKAEENESSHKEAKEAVKNPGEIVEPSQPISLRFRVENLHLGHVGVLRDKFSKTSNHNHVSVSLNWPMKTKRGTLDGDILIEGTKEKILNFLNQDFADVVRVGKPQAWGRRPYYGIPVLNGDVMVGTNKVGSVSATSIEYAPVDEIKKIAQELRSYGPVARAAVEEATL